MLRVFIGYDHRQPLAYNVLQHSIVRHASEPVSITPLILSQLPVKRRGLTEFTFSRFLVPWLCDFDGLALFLDSDMVMTGDVAELFRLDGDAPVNVMQEQDRFEWASCMVFNNEQCRILTPEYVNCTANNLLDLAWANSIGQLPTDWGQLVGYHPPKQAKLYHYTMGLPCWHETAGRQENDVWEHEYSKMLETCTWKELMINSVHAKEVLKRMIAYYVD